MTAAQLCQAHTTDLVVGDNSTTSSGASIKEESECEQLPKLSFPAVVILLGFVLIMVPLTAMFVVGSLDGFIDGSSLSQGWVSSRSALYVLYH